jgi:hypothetical protein
VSIVLQSVRFPHLALPLKDSGFSGSLNRLNWRVLVINRRADKRQPHPKCAALPFNAIRLDPAAMGFHDHLAMEHANSQSLTFCGLKGFKQRSR